MIAQCRALSANASSLTNSQDRLGQLLPGQLFAAPEQSKSHPTGTMIPHRSGSYDIIARLHNTETRLPSGRPSFSPTPQDNGNNQEQQTPTTRAVAAHNNPGQSHVGSHASAAGLPMPRRLMLQLANVRR